MQLKRIIKRDYNNWYKDNYIYEKKDDKYEPITFGRFIENSLSKADYLLKRGYKNKNIMIISENSIKLMELDLAITFYVGVCSIVSKEWKTSDLLEGIKELKADLLIYSPKYEEIIKEVKNNIKIDTININDIKEDFSDNLLDLNIKNQNKTAKIVFSSGTTGKSKGVKLSLKNIFAG